MIYDYVKYNGVTKIVDAVYLYSVSVHDPSEPWGVAKSELVSVDDIEPIKLTEEILVKNGFRYSISHNDWTNADCNFFLYEAGNGYRIQNTDIKLDYAHQLQHLLRLCGIEKELTI